MTFKYEKSSGVDSVDLRPISQKYFKDISYVGLYGIAIHLDTIDTRTNNINFL